MLTCDGHTYERASILEWLSKHNTSPKTGAELENKGLIPNHLIRGQIREYLEKKGANKEEDEDESEAEDEEELKKKAEDEEAARKRKQQEEEEEAKRKKALEQEKESGEPPIHRAINAGKLAGFAGVKVTHDKAGKDKTYIKLSGAVTKNIFSRVLEFLYTGMATIKDKSDSVQEILHAGNL